MTPRLPEEDELRQLAFIKYVFRLGMEQASQPEPLAAAALFLLHDAVDAFLQLACARFNQRVGEDKFMPLAGTVNAALQAQQETLPEFGRLDAFNAARGSLKHKGLKPSPHDIKRYVDMSVRFFDQATPLIFAVGFDAVSLVDLVILQTAREELKKAEAALGADDIGPGLRACAIAFAQLLKDYEDRKRNQWHGSPFEVGDRVHVPWQYKMPGRMLSASEFQNPSRDLSFQREVIECLEQFEKNLSQLRRALKIVGFGIDYRKYVRFQSLTPFVSHDWEGGLESGESPVDVTSREVQFAIDFVLEVALQLQGFDFDARAVPPAI